MSDVLDRFVRYCKVASQSDETKDPTNPDNIPTTESQFDIANVIADDLRELGAEDVSVDEHAYVICHWPASEGLEDLPTLGFCCHIDTAWQSYGSPVHPQVKRYEGGRLLIGTGRDGKEVYYKAAPTEQVRLLHIMIEKTMEISCPEESGGDIQSVPELPGLDAPTGGEGRYTAEQLDTIRRVHDLLTENLDRRYTIDELSRRFLINPSSLKEMFKAVYGKSLAAHIKEHRMELASELLRETGLSIAEIAERVGYENQSKFSAEFKKSVGSLPTEYRKLF